MQTNRGRARGRPQGIFQIPVLSRYFYLYKYEVTVDPEESERVCKKLMREISEFIPPGYLYDGRNLYTPSKFEADLFHILADNPDSPQESNIITLRLVDYVPLNFQQVMKFFEMIITMYRKQVNDLKLVGRSFYEAIYSFTPPRNYAELLKDFAARDPINYEHEFINEVKKGITDGNDWDMKPFLENYNCHFVSPEKKSRRAYLVPTTMQLEKQHTNGDTLKVLASYTRVRPEDHRNLLHLCGHELPQEVIYLGDNITHKVGNPSYHWSHQLKNKPIGRPTTLGTLKWLLFFPADLKAYADMFTCAFMQAILSMDLRIRKPRYIGVEDEGIESYIERMSKTLRKRMPSFVVCIIPKKDFDWYSKIKKTCYIDFGVPCQIVLRKTLDISQTTKFKAQIIHKIAIQVICKFGGTPWTLDIPVKGLMVVGLEVCPDPNDKNNCYGAFVASIDKNCTQYYHSGTIRPNGRWISEYFSFQMVQAVSQYKSLNLVLPKTIIIYRNGRFDDQLYDQEIKQIQKQLFTNYNTLIYLVYIAVTKRVRVRVFTVDGNIQFTNPKPGTIIENSKEVPNDFFLISHYVSSRRTTPTAYNVILDQSKLTPDQLQRLTYKFTHNYYTSTASLRVPAPCQYAHKLLKMMVKYLQDHPHPDLCNTLYFL